MGQKITEKIKKYWRKKSSRNIGESLTLIQIITNLIRRWFKNENS